MGRPKTVQVFRNKFHAEGARGGCYFEIDGIPGKPESAILNVGWSCVTVHQREIPISWLAEIIAIATHHKDGIAGFLKEHEDKHGGSYALLCDPPK